MSPRQARPGSTATVDATPLTLAQASEQLGVHYMTAYRYVRTGRLPASKHDGLWAVDPADVRRLCTRPSRGQPGRGRSKRRDRVPELADRLIAGDEQGAWALAQSVLAGGATPADLYLQVFVPALRLIGDRWESGEITVADEHCATVVMQRLVGRIGPMFRRPGRTRGLIVLGAPEGELHAIPTALAADLLRGHGFNVIDLGADVPTESFVNCVLALPQVIAIAITVTTSRRQADAAGLVVALRRAGLAAPIILGGSGIDEAGARNLGADQWADSASALLDLVSKRP